MTEQKLNGRKCEKSINKGSVTFIDRASYNPILLRSLLEPIIPYYRTEFKSAESTILVKPNVLSAVHSNRRVTTHPSLVEAVCRIFVERGNKVIVSDSSGGTMFGNSQSAQALEYSGIAEAARRAGAEVVSLENYGVSRYPGKIGKWQIYVTSLLEQVSVIINLPVFKTHTAQLITGAVKNLFGLVPGHIKASYHQKIPHIPTFSQFLVDLALNVKPDLTIVDAIECMHGDGPMNGNVYKAGILIISRNVFAVDIVLERLAGFKRNEVPTVAVASKLKLCTSSANELTGMDIKPLKGFKKPNLVDNDIFARFLFSSGIKWRRVFPTINPILCGNCGKCVRSCPSSCIEKRESSPIIKSLKCIRCLCCHEICQNGAIELHQVGLLKRILSLTHINI